MKVTMFGAGLLLLIGNEILSLLAVLIISIAFIATIMKERIER